MNYRISRKRSIKCWTSIQGGVIREQQFTGDASHEMRNPLEKMIVEIDLALSKQREPDDYRDSLQRLRKYAEGMQQLTESLLILARLDGKLHDEDILTFDMAELAMEVLKRLPDEEARRIKLDFGKDPGAMETHGQRYLIGVLLSTLLDNALRYSPPESSVWLRIIPGAGAIDVEVVDEGPGIPVESTEAVIRPFLPTEKIKNQANRRFGPGFIHC